MPAKKSLMMDKLYGKVISNAVYDRCQELGNNFNKLVQEFVYDIFWARSGLRLKEKSLITITSLITLNKAEQLQIHLKGFFHQGGNADDIRRILNYMTKSGYISSPDKALAILNTVISGKSSTKTTKLSLINKSKDKALIDLSAHIALGDNNKTEAYIKKLLKNKILSAVDIENTLLHQVIYCGVPCAMNGFAVMKNIKCKLKEDKV